jgi:hypothetical protein
MDTDIIPFFVCWRSRQKWFCAFPSSDISLGSATRRSKLVVDFASSVRFGPVHTLMGQLNESGILCRILIARALEA